MRGRGGPWLFFCGSKELLASESIWRFPLEVYELGYFCKGFDVGFSGSVYDYGDYFDVCF